MPVTEHGGVSLAWEETGRPDGAAILFVHSLGCDRSMWASQVEALRAEYRLVLVDIRGHGRSAAPPGPYRVEDLGSDVLAVADDAGLERFHLCGLSIGGLIALWIAIHHGDRLESLAACNTAAKIGTAQGWSARIDAIRAGGMDSVRPAVVERWFAPGFAHANPDAFAGANEVFSATSPEGYIGCCSALAAADLREDAGSISVRSLLIGGDLDVSTPPTDTEWLHERIAGSQMAILEGAAHLSNLDQPEAFTDVLRRFLSPS